MLYASTRSKVETYTAQRTVWAERASDGGFFVPIQLPQFRRTEVLRMKNNMPEDNIAMVMNHFFQTEFSGKEVEYLIGREYYKLVNISHKMILGQLWHNPDGEIDYILKTLVRQFAAEQRDGEPGEWPRVVVRIALLFALICELEHQGVVTPLYPIDVAIPTGDFTWPMAAWYARKMGLPIHSIICCSNEHDAVRELLHRGQIRLDGVKYETITPRCDCTVPVGIERAIHTAFGRDETDEYLRTLERGGTYSLNPEQKRLLSEGMYAAVNSNKRLSEVIPNAYRTFGHVLCPYSAMVYTGVMDYQSITGQYNKVLMLCDYSPRHSLEATSRAMGIDKHELKRRLNLT